MKIEKRLQFLRTEKAKILGFARSHLRSVESARRLYKELDRKLRKARMEFSSTDSLHLWLWEFIAERCDELLRREHFQFRVFDEGGIEILDENFIKRPGGFIEEQVKVVQNALTGFPEKAIEVLQLHYQYGLSCKAIAKRIGVPLDEVYQLWQHSMIYLWEGAQNEGHPGFQEKEDEDFWTHALRYLDGSASEKFVAELNSEIHVTPSRIKEYNDLRVIDGVMIEYGLSGEWPNTANLENLPELPEDEEKTKVPLGERLEPVGNWFGDIFSSIAAFFIGVGAFIFGATGNLFAKLKNFRIQPRPIVSDQKPVPRREAEPVPEPEAKKDKDKETVAEPTAPSEPAPEPGQLPPPPSIPLPPTGQKSQPENKSPETPESSVAVDSDKKTPVASVGESTEKNQGVASKVAILGILGAFIGGMFLLSQLGGLSFGQGSKPRIIRGVNVSFAKGEINRGRLESRDYDMTSGTMRFQTTEGVEAIVEAPARFSIKSGNRLFFESGRMVVAVSESAGVPAEVGTSRFKVSSRGGEVGFIADDSATEVVVFSGNAQLAAEESDPFDIAPGTGLRFTANGDPENLFSRDEAHRFPELIPVTTPKKYGDNLVANNSFEVGLLSRSCKTERLYRDIPLGWEAGWQKNGKWVAPMEQHSGTVRITDAIGGLPPPIHGERYLWINHGFVSQGITGLEPGAKYELTLHVASHRNLGPGSKHLIRNVGGNTFQFGIWSGTEWIAEASGQLEAGQPFQPMKLEFTCPNSSAGEQKIVAHLMLTGETRIFYDNVILRKLDSGPAKTKES